ncbi:hypothetical protein H4219_005168 [Mycoemilia scoparia]|uniref:Uncharacterized protein n=1 Tax=Mycoemilia scoparia TaxID=417184 RepID=A0A9W7ZVQ0_9FUNG|nr:hypothetical protein H4219_005168 [Mycoemilia scoparia]
MARVNIPLDLMCRLNISGSDDLVLTPDSSASPPSTSDYTSDDSENGSMVFDTHTTSTAVVIGQTRRAHLIDNIARLAILNGYIEKICYLLCSWQPILGGHLFEYTSFVTLVLYKYTCFNVVENIVVTDNEPLIDQLMEHGKGLITKSVIFARRLKSVHETSPDQQQQLQQQQDIPEYEPTVTAKAADLAEGNDSNLDHGNANNEILFNGTQYYCGLIILTCAFLFCSTVFPDVDFYEQHSELFPMIDEASKLYAELRKKDQTGSQIDDLASDYSDESESGDRSDYSAESDYDVDEEDDEDKDTNSHVHYVSNDNGDEDDDIQHLFGDAIQDMFEQITQNDDIINMISDSMTGVEYLENIPLVDYETGVVENVHIKGFGETPLGPSEWIDDLQAAGYFSYDSIMNRMELYKQASQYN